MKECVVNFLWDSEALVWTATSDDVPGLVLEHGSFDALVERVRLAVPEMLALNASHSGDIFIRYNTQRLERLVG